MPYVPPTLPPSGVQVNKGVQAKVTGRRRRRKGEVGGTYGVRTQENRR